MDERIIAVQRMQDYIKEHLDEEITLSALARESMFSPWYSYRIFRSCTGLTPADYVRRFRLAKAALELKNGKKVIDVAFGLGFKSADGFTRAFSREFGLLPSEYAKNPLPVTLFVPYGVKYRELRKEKTMKEVKNVFIQVVKKPARKVVIKRGKTSADYFSYCEEVGCDVWGKLLSMDSLCGEPVCLYLPDKYRNPMQSVYVMGVERAADEETFVPEGFDVITLPETEYLMFQGEPFCEEDYCEAIAAVQNAAGNYNPSAIGYEWNDAEPRIQLEPRGERGYIEMRAVRKLR